MAGNRTWKRNTDRNAMWEAARRLHTAASNEPESATDLSMDYDIASAYKAFVATPAGAPCWTTTIPMLYDSQMTVFTLSTDKSSGSDTGEVDRQSGGRQRSRNAALRGLSPQSNPVGVRAGCPKPDYRPRTR